MSERAVSGDFHVIRMGGLFHVVFRPDSDPEWFRIIASFYTYERAYSYCDIERVSVWTYKDANGEEYAESETGEEEMGGLRVPPIDEAIPEGWMATRDGAAELVRSVMEEADEAVTPHPPQDFSDQPHEGEPPKEYHKRVFAEAVAEQPAVAPPPAKPEEPEPAAAADPMAEAIKDLTDNQWSVLQFFRSRVQIGETVTASMKEIAVEAGVAQGSMPYFLETLERKGFIEIVTRGTTASPGEYRLLDPVNREDKSPKCETCGGPRSPGSVAQCQSCYRGGLRDLPPEVVSELSKAGQKEAADARNA